MLTAYGKEWDTTWPGSRLGYNWKRWTANDCHKIREVYAPNAFMVELADSLAVDYDKSYTRRALFEDDVAAKLREAQTRLAKSLCETLTFRVHDGTRWIELLFNNERDRDAFIAHYRTRPAPSQVEVALRQCVNELQLMESCYQDGTPVWSESAEETLRQAEEALGVRK